MSVTSEPVREPHALAAKRDERRAAGVACGAHALHDGYTDLIYVMPRSCCSRFRSRSRSSRRWRRG